MILPLGLLALLQALFLPGMVVVQVLRIRGVLSRLTAALALSLLLNFGIVALLVALHAYHGWALFAVFAIEMILLVWLSRQPAAAPLAAVPPAAAPPAPEPPAKASLADALAMLAVILLALWYAGRVARAASGIFSGWDDVASWNRWALDWARGRWPQHTWHYPQIVPVAWSLTYRFTGHAEVQGFARGMMPLFGLGAMAALAALARGPFRLAALAAAWFAGIFLARLNNVTAGLADVPVAFFTAMALAEVLKASDDAPATGAPRNLAWVYAAGAALTKQAGFFVVLVVPALLAWRRPASERTRALLLDYARIAAVVLPWYLVKQFQIATGSETSEIGHVLTGAHHGLGPAARAITGGARLAELAGGWPVLAALLALAAIGLGDRRVRPIVLAVAVPFTLLWAFGFSYDPRNLSVALPAWALGCGAGLARIASRVPWPKLDLSRFAFHASPTVRRRATSVIPVLIFLLAVRFPDRALIAHSQRLQLGLGDLMIGRELDRLRTQGELDRHIAADAGYLLAYAPGWDSLFVAERHEDPAKFVALVARPDIGWLVLRRDASLGRLLEVWEQEGAWRLRVRSATYELWERSAPRR